jgi:hypothetical protein
MNTSHDNIHVTNKNERTAGLFKTIFLWLGGHWLFQQ